MPPTTPIGKRLVKHPQTAIVDFTGSARFGAWVEANAHPALCFSETSGVNTVVVESVEALEPVLKSLATTMSLFSAQMCTSPQNVYVPRDGVRCGDRRIGADEFGAALAAAIAAIASDPRRAAPIMAAIQSPGTPALIDQLRRRRRPARARAARLGTVRERRVPAGAHPHAAAARRRVGREGSVRRGALRPHRLRGHDGGSRRRARPRRPATRAPEAASPRSSIRPTPRSSRSRRTPISAAGAQLTCNLTGPMPLNFAAAYSDYHVTGLNPAGNATLTDLAFVASRFRITQSRSPADG